MRNFIVLGDTVSKKRLNQYNYAYKGIEREGIRIPYEYWEGTNSNDIIESFKKYDKLMEEQCYISNITFAMEICKLYNKYYPEINYQVFELLFTNERVNKHSQELAVLGYDIISCHYSSILNLILPENQYITIPNDYFEFYAELEKVTKNAYLELNSNMLFNDAETATYYNKEIGKVHIKYNRFPTHLNFHIVKLVDSVYPPDSNSLEESEYQ